MSYFLNEWRTAGRVYVDKLDSARHRGIIQRHSMKMYEATNRMSEQALSCLQRRGVVGHKH